MSTGPAITGPPAAPRPNFLIRARTVLRVNPRRAAAREMFQSVSVRTCSSCSRTASRADRRPGIAAAGAAVPGDGDGAAGRARSAAEITDVPARSAARSIMLLSSRTLPGH